MKSASVVINRSKPTANDDDDKSESSDEESSDEEFSTDANVFSKERSAVKPLNGEIPLTYPSLYYIHRDTKPVARSGGIVVIQTMRIGPFKTLKQCKKVEGAVRFYNKSHAGIGMHLESKETPGCSNSSPCWNITWGDTVRNNSEKQDSYFWMRDLVEWLGTKVLPDTSLSNWTTNIGSLNNRLRSVHLKHVVAAKVKAPASTPSVGKIRPERAWKKKKK